MVIWKNILARRAEEAERKAAIREINENVKYICEQLQKVPSKEDISNIKIAVDQLSFQLSQQQKQISDLKKSFSNLSYASEIDGALTSAKYFNKHLVGKPVFDTKEHLLAHALSLLDGDVKTPMEFGVYSGDTVNFIARNIDTNTIVYGFDSFEGLPENWRGSFKKGTFALDQLPSVMENVALVQGWFEDSLPKFKTEVLQDQKTNFLHIDCDLYSSTRTIFDVLSENIANDCVIVFDEYFNYPGWQNHEAKAFKELIVEQNFSFEYVGCVPKHQQLAVRLTGKLS